MDLEIFDGYSIKVSQIQILNPGLLLLILPIYNKGIYPLLKRLGIQMTPLFHKMGIGMFLASLSFITSAILELYIDSQLPNTVPLYYIIPQFLLITCGEIMISVTGLEFAYSEAPASMKSLVMAGWCFTTALGNLLVALVALIQFSMVINYLTYAGLMSFFYVIIPVY